MHSYGRTQIPSMVGLGAHSQNWTQAIDLNLPRLKNDEPSRHLDVHVKKKKVINMRKPTYILC